MSKRYRVVRSHVDGYWMYRDHGIRAKGPGPRANVHHLDDGSSWFDRRLSNEVAAQMFNLKSKDSSAAEKKIKVNVAVKKPAPVKEEPHAFKVDGYVPEVWKKVMSHKDFDPRNIMKAIKGNWCGKFTYGPQNGRFNAFPSCCGAQTYTDFYGIGRAPVAGSDEYRSLVGAASHYETLFNKIGSYTESGQYRGYGFLVGIISPEQYNNSGRYYELAGWKVVDEAYNPAHPSRGKSQKLKLVRASCEDPCFRICGPSVGMQMIEWWKSSQKSMSTAQRRGFD